jgi:hypothetical protein
MIYKTPEIIMKYIKQKEDVIKVRTKDISMMLEITQFLTSKGYIFTENIDLSKKNFYKK